MESFVIENMPIDMSIVDNLYIPIGNYMLNITLSMQNELIVSGEFYFTLPDGKTIDDDRMG